MVACDSGASSDRERSCGGLCRFHVAAGTEPSAYLPSALHFLPAICCCSALPLSSVALLILLIAILTIDGFGKIITAWRRSYPDRLPLVLNGLIDFGSAAVIWVLSRFIGIAQAIGIIVGVYIVAAGWRMLLAPIEPATADTAAKVLNAHPDPRLAVPGNQRFSRLRSEADSGSQFVRAADLLWMSTLGIVFLAIHAGRMPLTDDLLGRISPFVATAGDVLMTLVFAPAYHASGAFGLAACDKAGRTSGVVPTF